MSEFLDMAIVQLAKGGPGMEDRDDWAREVNENALALAAARERMLAECQAHDAVLGAEAPDCPKCEGERVKTDAIDVARSLAVNERDQARALLATAERQRDEARAALAKRTEEIKRDLLEAGTLFDIPIADWRKAQDELHERNEPAAQACEHEWDYRYVLCSLPPQYRCKKCQKTATDEQIRAMKSAPPRSAGGEWTRAERDVLAERAKQRAKWGDEHDDEHADHSLPQEARMLVESTFGIRPERVEDPWGLIERHPDPRERLVIASALLIAEVNRMDRRKHQNAPTASAPDPDDETRCEGCGAIGTHLDADDVLCADCYKAAKEPSAPASTGGEWT